MSGITADSSRRLIETLERDAAAKIAELEKDLAAKSLAERAAVRQQVEEIRADLKKRVRALDACLF
jgi:hypothetical protein